MVKIYKFPEKLKNDSSSYSCLIDFYAEWKNLTNERIVVDFDATTRIEANLVALLGAIFDEITDIPNMNNLFITNLNSDIETILKKNNFLSYFGYQQIDDTFNTTVEYCKIKSYDVRSFTEYLNNKLFTQKHFSNMPPHLKKILISSLAEIFINANMHTGCLYVYTCGQYFPYDNRLDFTIVNLGTTIRENVESFYRKHADEYLITSTNAIKWAVQDYTTTKENESGGFGLSRTKEFIKNNKGKLFIISDDGCWFQDSCGKIYTERFPNSFGGTIVNFEINMNDTYNYDII